MIFPPKYYNEETGKYEGKHTMLIGQTGFGKTYLGMKALRERNFVVVHDGKRTFREKLRNSPEAEQWDFIERFDDRPKQSKNRICYSPTAIERKDSAIQEEFWNWILLRGNTTVFVDDIVLAMPDNHIPSAMADAYMVGRELGVEIWGCTQQPVFVDNVCFTQSRVFCVFYCALDSHRDKVASFVPVENDEVKALKPKEFFMYEDSWEKALGPLILGPNNIITRSTKENVA